MNQNGFKDEWMEFMRNGQKRRHDGKLWILKNQL